jgi:ABC-type multidrug transport system fused ATPase/permease subunit
MEKSCKIAYPHFESPAFLNRITRAREDAVVYGCSYALNAIMVGRTALSFIGCMALLLWVAPIWTVPVILIAATPPFLFDVARARRLFELEGMSMDRNRQAWYIEWLLATAELIKDIRAFGIGRWLVSLHSRINEPFQDKQVALARRHFKTYIAMNMFTAIVPYAPFGYFVVGTVHGESSLGQLLFFLLAFNQCSAALSQMSLAFSTAFEHHLYVHNLVKLLDFAETDPDSEPQIANVLPVAPALSVENLWFSYPGSDRPIFRGLNLQVRAGEILAIVGRNGIGKTTLVKILLGIYASDRGRISIGGVDIATRSIGWRRDNIGILMQDFVRYQFSVSDGVGIGWIPDVGNSEMIAKALQTAEAGEIVSSLPQGMDTPLGPAFGGQDLSGGQWQRMALARLFMRPSRLWILDEPTSAMDPKTEEQVFECFRQSAAGRTAIIITHRFSAARIADRIAVVDEGRVAEIGTHEELLSAKGYYAEIFNLQAQVYASGAS